MVSRHWLPRNFVLDYAWVYEIDFDRKIFHVNGMPFYSLECLPDEEDFLKYLLDDSDDGRRDHYGHIACASECPPEHKYKRPAPPVVDDSDIATYQSLVCAGSHMALSDMLAIRRDILSPDENVRVSLLEVTIGQCMVREDLGEIIYKLGVVFDHNQLTDEEWSIACSMANFAFVPQIFDRHICHPILSRKEFSWVREDTVFTSQHIWMTSDAYRLPCHA